MKTRLVACLGSVLLFACPTPPGMDGGTGGGGLFGGGTGGGTAGGGTGGGTGGGMGGPVTFDQFCTSYGSTLCAWATRCQIFNSRAGCDAFTAQSDPTEFLCDPARASIADGRQTFDGTTAGACLAQLAGAGCSYPTACGSTYFTGTVPLDGGCYAEGDCGPNSFCDATQMVCPGRCREAMGVAGTVVRNTVDCRDGLYAKGFFDGGSFLYECVPYGALGAMCTSGGGCQVGLVCNTDTGQCEQPRGQNAVCSQSDGGISPFANICQGFLFCRPETTSTRAVCSAPGAPGEGCFPGSFGSCRFDLRCLPATDGGAAGTCAPLGTVGTPCASNNDCDLSLFCAMQPMMTSGSCAMPLPAGAECPGSNRSCQSGLACEFGPKPDGGFGSRCLPWDGGTTNVGCFDPTP